jgi:hypothetical protein
MATTISNKRLDKNKKVLSEAQKKVLTETLMERKSTHGDFSVNSAISQQMKMIIREFDGNLSETQKEALDMIVHKISRILAGDPNHKDSWHDIAGYAKLVEDRII